jgi:hypothetical protein
MVAAMAETSHRRINAIIAVTCVLVVVVKMSGKSMGARAAGISNSVMGAVFVWIIQIACFHDGIALLNSRL